MSKVANLIHRINSVLQDDSYGWCFFDCLDEMLDELKLLDPEEAKVVERRVDKERWFFNKELVYSYFTFVTDALVGMGLISEPEFEPIPYLAGVLDIEFDPFLDMDDLP